VRGHWRKLQIEGLHDLYFFFFCSTTTRGGFGLLYKVIPLLSIHDLYYSLNFIQMIIKKNAIDGEGGTYMGEEANVQGLVGKPQGKRPV
jgi:hypothetical protein